MATNAWIDDAYYVNELGEWCVENHDTSSNSSNVENNTTDGWRNHHIDLSNATLGEAVDHASAQNFLDYRNNH